MNNIKKILIIAKYTFKEISNSKILLNTVFLGLALFVITFIAYSFTYGEPSRIALDFGMGMLSLSSIGIAIFIGVGLLSNEIASRTVYMIISRPVPRYAFIAGKLLGLSMILILNILILSVTTLSLYFMVGGEFSPLIAWAIVFTILESIMVLFFVSLLSLLTKPTMTVIISLTVYVLGHSIGSAQETSFARSFPGLLEVLEVYHYILPGFYKLNIKHFLLYKQTLPFSYLSSATLYGVLYSTFLVCLTIFTFDRKNID